MSRNKKMSFLEILLVAIAVTVLLWSPAWAAETIEVLRNPRYTMGGGDTLPMIAQRYGVKGGPDEIVNFAPNRGLIRLSPNGRFAFPQPGDKFYIPGLYKKVQVSPSGIKPGEMVVVPWGRISAYRLEIANLSTALAAQKKAAKAGSDANSQKIASLEKTISELHSQVALSVAAVTTFESEAVKKDSAIAATAKIQDEQRLMYNVAKLGGAVFIIIATILFLARSDRRSQKGDKFQTATPETVMAAPESDSVAKIRQLMAVIENRQQAEALVGAAMEMTGGQLEIALNTTVVHGKDRDGSTMLKNMGKLLGDEGMRPHLLDTKLCDMSHIVAEIRAKRREKKAG